METVAAVVVLIAIVGAAALYIRKSKKRGQKCIGCPYSDGCNGGCHGGFDHSQHTDE